jgi:acetyl-CoA acetyltransferase
MREAVIVSYARTGMTKTHRGGLNDTHPIVMGGHVMSAALSVLAWKPPPWKTCSSAPPSRKAQRA